MGEAAGRKGKRECRLTVEWRYLKPKQKLKLATTKEHALFPACHWTEQVSLPTTVYPFPLPSIKKCNALTSRVRGDRAGMPSSMKLHGPSSQPEAG